MEYTLGPSLGKQLKLADARGRQVAVVVGPDERARGEVILKDLAARRSVSVARDRSCRREIAGRLQAKAQLDGPFTVQASQPEWSE